MNIFSPLKGQKIVSSDCAGLYYFKPFFHRQRTTKVEKKLSGKLEAWHFLHKSFTGKLFENQPTEIPIGFLLSLKEVILMLLREHMILQ